MAGPHSLIDDQCECVNSDLVFSGASWIVLHIKAVVIVVLVVASLDKLILGPQVQVPQPAGCPVLWTVGLHSHMSVIGSQLS